MGESGQVAVYGEALVDDFLSEQVVGGAPFNVARNLAAFGTSPLMITRIGLDEHGGLIRSEFRRFGLDGDGVQLDARAPTGRVMVKRTPQGHRFIVLPEQAYDHIEARPALTALEQHPAATIYFGTLAQRGTQSRNTLLRLLQASDATRFLDLNLREGQFAARTIDESLQLADIVKVNEEELDHLFKCYAPSLPAGAAARPEDAAAAEACRALQRRFALQGLLVTLGARGAVYFDGEGQLHGAHDGVAPAHFIDTVGAGDAFSAVFLLGRLQGWPLPLTLARAHAFAAAICGIAGAVPPDLEFYAPWLAGWRSR
ncbi:PfkB family carbohydrate kinase [Pseudoduganella violacea]|uniref:Fructokinase n=1 Tax=Pseudoduganella violacea TaxID=1715466 RepID=A0A7W5BCM5_9BURK|nr:PfkB family carbohydrate kinase [Pseudoduganella violacea]MBB3119865.1 fructokinase [Pseudoduganella violacea]